MVRNFYHRGAPTATQTALSAALCLARRGIPVVPFDAQCKRPVTARGSKDATTDEGAIRTWFARPGLVPAIATGEVGGIDALDLDLPKHPEVRQWLAENEAGLPPTFAYSSRSGGRHIWFRHHPGLRCSTARPVPGVDVRADGGTAIAWFSIGCPILARAPLADWPQLLLEAIAPPPRPALAPPPLAAWCGNDRRARAYAEGALANAIRRVASAAPGERNATLNTQAFALSRFVADGSLTAAELAFSLAAAAASCGLDPIETKATVKSALQAGVARR
jgi:hypothetical protein